MAARAGYYLAAGVLLFTWVSEPTQLRLDQLLGVICLLMIFAHVSYLLDRRHYTRAMMLVAMACSPFLHNAPTVLVFGPIAVGVASGLGLRPDAFLMAVAVGSGCDFLTPIGHQCNTLVMGPGGYRFGDYWRLGLPLSIMVAVLGTVLIRLAWPLH